MKTESETDNSFKQAAEAIPKTGARVSGKAKVIILSVVVLFCVAFTGVFIYTGKKPGDGKPSDNPSNNSGSNPAGRPVLTVNMQPVKSLDFERKLLVSGTVSAWDPVQVGSEANGLKVEAVLVDEGAHVRRGQVMAKLNGSVLRAQLAQQEARLASSRAGLVKAIQPNRPEDLTALKAAYAQSQAATGQEEANLARAKASFAEAEANSKRYEGLVREGAVSALEGLTRTTLAKTTQADVHNAEQKVAAARFTAQQAHERMVMGVAGGRQEDISISRSSLAEIEATVKQLASQVDQTIIKAPCDGLVVKRSVHLGDIAMTNKVMFDMVRDGRLELKAQVPESDLSRIRAGQKVAVVAALGAGTEVEGTVREISPSIDLDSRLGTVRIDLPAQAVSIYRPGNFARGEIFLGKEPVLSVPSSCVVYKDNRPLVFTVSPAGLAQMRFVEAGERDMGNIEIRSGLKSGDAVVAKGAGFLKDGDRVNVRREQ
jgi:HlyD family secretion protein